MNILYLCRKDLYQNKAKLAKNNSKHNNIKTQQNIMERTLVLLKPVTIQRGLAGEVIKRFEQKGLKIAGMKMMQLDDAILNEHYAHLVDRPFFPGLKKSMTRTPVVAMCLEGVGAVDVVRQMAGATNGRKALPGTIRGDFSMSGQQNIVHASDSLESAAVEVKRFFKDEEIFDYAGVACTDYGYADDEV